MHEGASDVDVALAAGGEQPRADAIDDDARGGDYHHGPTGDGLSVEKPADRLPAQSADHHQQKHSVEQSREDRRTAESIGESQRRRALDENAGDPCDEKSQHVAEIVASVRQQGDGVPDETENDFQHHKTGIERDAYRERSAEARGRVTVTARAVVMVMTVVTVIVVVVIVIVAHEPPKV